MRPHPIRLASRIAPACLALITLVTLPSATPAQATRPASLPGPGLTSEQRKEISAAGAEAKASFDAVERRRINAAAPYSREEVVALRAASARQLARIRAVLTPAERAAFDQRLVAARQAHAAERDARLGAQADAVRPKPAPNQRLETRAAPPPATRQQGSDDSAPDMAGAR